MNDKARSKIVGLVVLLTFLVGCSSSTPVPTATVLPTQTLPPPTPTTIPRASASIAEVERTASAFEALARLEGEAWHSADSQAFRAVFSAEAVFTDRTFGDHAAGIEAIEALAANTALLVPTWKARSIEQYISLAGGFEVVNIWDLELGGHKFTEADPLVELDWLQTRDNSITAMTLLYGLDSLKKSFSADRERLDQAGSLLSAYQSAWSSGDAQAVAALYSSDSVREDSLLGEKQPGREAIAHNTRLHMTSLASRRSGTSGGWSLCD